MIDFVEVRNANREVIGIIDDAQSVIWHSVYFGVGDFEIYVSASLDYFKLLQVGNYITRIDNDEVGIIEAINVTFDTVNGRMLKAVGRFAKSILDRRLIYKLSGTGAKKTNNATILSGNVEEAVRKLVDDNAISSSAERNISILKLGALKGYQETIQDEKQVSYENLLAYTEALLEEYEMASKCTLDSDKKLKYEVYKGEDKSNQIVFSQEFDNLISSDYSFDATHEKNVALIGGQGEGIERFYSLFGSAAGLERKEIFVEASSLSKKYKPNETSPEQEYADDVYAKMLNAQGRQTLVPLIKIESFSGAIDITNSIWKLGTHFNLGDKVKVQDNEIMKYINCRIVEILEAQDENGYSIEVIYK